MGERYPYTVSFINRLRATWQEDGLLRRVVRNSSYLFSSNTVSAVLGFVQGILTVRLLGMDGYGLVSGTIMIFASNVNRLLSFRMSEVVVKYTGEAMEQGDNNRAGAIVKGIGITEAITSVVAYFVLFVLSPLMAKDPAAISLFRFYGLFLLANLVYETSTGVLQITDKFNRVAIANLVQSIATAALIFLAFLMKWGAFEILVAYFVGKVIAGLIVTGSAVQEANRRFGSGWTRVPLRHLSDWKSIGGFVLSTNLNGTVNLFVRDNIPLYIGFFRPDAEVGYFKLAMSLLNLVMLPIEPFIWPTYAEITRTIAQRQWNATRRLLKQVSAIAGTWTILAGGALAALGWWLIPFIYGSASAPAYPAVLVLLLGLGFANTLHWNRPLLLALGKPASPLIIAGMVGLVEIALIFLFVPNGGYLLGSAITSGFFIVSIGWTVVKGLQIIKREEDSS